MPRYTRRRLIAAGFSAATIGSIAGCTSSDLGNTGSNSDGPIAQSSFFVFGDFTTEVAGETATAETLVPIGQHGHGWEPGPDIQKTILESDLFVNGMEGFQPWADNLVTSLRDDEANVHIVAAGAGIDLTEGGHDYGHGHQGEHDSDHEEEHTHEGERKHEDKEGHDHSHTDGTDPHFWLDPIRAKQAVGNIRSGFVDVDSDNASAYADNADQYRSRLNELDSTFQSTLQNASKSIVFVAGHNAFQYLGNRYGFEVHSLTGNLSPDDQPTPKDIERAQKIIAKHDLKYICADPLESQRAADQLVEETDATEILPLTPIPGQSQEWANKGWGYVEIMENVNLETLKRALNVE